MGKNIKSIFFILSLFFLLYGCSNKEDIKIKQVSSAKKVTDEKTKEICQIVYDNYAYLEDNIKDEIIKLSLLNNDFKSKIKEDLNPAEDFRNSEFISELKSFFNSKDSLEIEAQELNIAFPDNYFFSVTKKFAMDGKKYTIRVIGYWMNLDVRVLADSPIESNWIFVQCWNEEEFYFSTVSNGDVLYFNDFMPLEVEGKLNLVLSGYIFSYSHPQFLSCWQLENNQFEPSPLFSEIKGENNYYKVYDIIEEKEFLYEPKWILRRNDTFLYANKMITNERKKVQMINFDCMLFEKDSKIKFYSDYNGKDKSELIFFFDTNKFLLES